MKPNSETQEIYRRYGALFSKVKVELEGGKTLKPAGWLVTAALYPNDSEPQGAGMQVFRPN